MPNQILLEVIYLIIYTKYLIIIIIFLLNRPIIIDITIKKIIMNPWEGTIALYICLLFIREVLVMPSKIK